MLIHRQVPSSGRARASDARSDRGFARRVEENCGLMSYAQRKEMSSNRTVAIIIVALIHVAARLRARHRPCLQCHQEGGRGSEDLRRRGRAAAPRGAAAPARDSRTCRRRRWSRRRRWCGPTRRRRRSFRRPRRSAAGDHADRAAGAAGAAGSAAAPACRRPQSAKGNLQGLIQRRRLSADARSQRGAGHGRASA